MSTPEESVPGEFALTGHGGALHARRWPTPERPAYVALLCHGYGEHIGRYEWVAETLGADGAAVYALDHVGHGRSEGERVLIEDFEPVVEDFRLLEQAARADHPDLPVVLIGHSMGGLIATRYAQRFGTDLAAVVLSGPVLGRWEAVEQLLPMPEIPEVPIDPETLSRDLAIGEAYDDDPLVWHGPFKRATLQALVAGMETIAAGGRLGDVPVLYLHGEDDQLVPLDPSMSGWAVVAGRHTDQRIYPGARHEIFNEVNKDEVLGDVTAFVARVL